MKTHPYRRVALASVALALPLSALALTSPASSSSTPTVVSSALAEAEAAELEAVRAAEAVPEARKHVQATLKKAQKSRARTQKIKGNVDKLVKRLQKQRNVAKNAKKPKRRANARKRVKNIQVRVKNRRAVLRTVRANNKNNWANRRAAVAARDQAIAHVPVAQKRAVTLRELADKVVAEHTTVTSINTVVLPPVHQPGKTTSNANAAKHVVAVNVTPAVRYLSVDIERQQGSGWVKVATVTTHENGDAHTPVATNGTYRAVVNGTTSAPAKLQQSLDFSDEFSGNKLDDVWVHRMQMHRPESKRACSKGSPKAVDHTKDTVRLWVKKDTSRAANCRAFYNGKYYPGHSYRLNGHIGTQGTYSFTYGVAAARVKFQKSHEGQHAAFWLQPASHSGQGLGPKHMGAEIDVVEFMGMQKNGRAGIGRGVWYNDDRGVQKHVGGMLTKEQAERYMADKDDKWFNRYHVFSVEWTPTEYVYRIDGDEFFRTSEGISQRPQYPILSLLSSDYSIARAGAAGEKELGTQNMEVDWIRVWR